MIGENPPSFSKDVTRPISRVLSWTVIYLGLALPSRLTPPPRNAQGYASCSSTVLLRIGFTGPRGLPRAGELLPRLSILTGKSRRYLSVALSLGSPPAAVSRYPCPEELGLSSDGCFRAPPATVQPAHMLTIVKERFLSVNSFFRKASGSFHPTISGKDPHSNYGDFQTG